MAPIDKVTLQLAKTRTAAAIQLFKAGNAAGALAALRAAEADFPFFTPAIAWQIPVLDALGETREMARVYDFAHSVCVIDLDSIDARSNRLAQELAAVIDRKVAFKPGTSTMPLVSASVSSDLTGLRDPAIAHLRTTILDCCRRYLRTAQFRNRHIAKVDDCWLSFWSTRTRRRGSIGPHYHARSWISWVFYPSAPSRSAMRAYRGGELELGHVPAIMGTLRRPCLLRIRPRPGRLVLFPSYIGHAVMPVASLHARFSIAGDLGVMPGPAADRQAGRRRATTGAAVRTSPADR